MAISLLEKPWAMSSSISLSLAVTGLSIISEDQTVFTITEQTHPFPYEFSSEKAAWLKPIQTFTITNLHYQETEVKLICNYGR